MLLGGGGLRYCTPVQQGWLLTILSYGVQWQFPCHLFIQAASLTLIAVLPSVNQETYNVNSIVSEPSGCELMF